MPEWGGFGWGQFVSEGEVHVFGVCRSIYITLQYTTLHYAMLHYIMGVIVRPAT